MALTRSIKDTIKARADRDPAFRDALRTEAVDGFLAGAPESGKAPLHHDIDATTGFERPGHGLDSSASDASVAGSLS